VDHYAVLGCSADAPSMLLKRAYHAKLREFHPDKRPASPTDSGKERTQALYAAWQVLGDPARREEYDKQWRQHGLGRGHALFESSRAACTQRPSAGSAPKRSSSQPSGHSTSDGVSITPTASRSVDLRKTRSSSTRGRIAGAMLQPSSSSAWVGMALECATTAAQAHPLCTCKFTQALYGRSCDARCSFCRHCGPQTPAAVPLTPLRSQFSCQGSGSAAGRAVQQAYLPTQGDPLCTCRFLARLPATKGGGALCSYCRFCEAEAVKRAGAGMVRRSGVA